VLAFEKYLLESASLSNAELTENGVQLFRRNVIFQLQWSVWYDLDLEKPKS